MKKLFIWAMSALALFSCSENDVVLNEGSDELVEVKLGFGGEYEITHAPMTRAEGTDIYYVTVYESNDGGTTYSSYAKGVFNDPEKISIMVNNNLDYRFHCEMWDDGRNVLEIIRHTEGDLWVQGFGTLNNEFTYTTDGIFEYPEGMRVKNPEIDSSSSVAGVYQNIKRYVGSADYSPANNDDVVTIDLLKGFAGLTVNVNDLYGGTMEVKSYVSSLGSLKNLLFYINEDDKQAEGAEYKYSDVRNMALMGVSTIARQRDLNYTETVNLTIKYKYEIDGTPKEKNIISQLPVLFQRNVMTTINIKLTEPGTADSSASANITIEEDGMGESKPLTFEADNSGEYKQVDVNPEGGN